MASPRKFGITDHSFLFMRAVSFSPQRTSALIIYGEAVTSRVTGLSSSKKGFARILVAVDGSEVSMRAAEQAVRIARQDGAQLHALHVVRVPAFEVPGGLANYFENARKDARKWMKDVEAIATAHGIGVKTEVVVGAYSVVDAILGYAETVGADLIVTGTRGQTPSRRMLLGSVADGLVEFASCAVLVIR